MHLVFEKDFPNTSILFNTIRNCELTYKALEKTLLEEELILTNDNLESMLRFFDYIINFYNYSDIEFYNTSTDLNLSSITSMFEKEVIEKDFKYYVKYDKNNDIFFYKRKENASLLEPFKRRYEVTKKGYMKIDILVEKNLGIKKKPISTYIFSDDVEKCVEVYDINMFTYHNCNRYLFGSVPTSSYKFDYSVYLTRNARYIDATKMINFKTTSDEKIENDFNVLGMDNDEFVDYVYHAIILPYLKYEKIIENVIKNSKYNRLLGIEHIGISKLNSIVIKCKYILFNIIKKILFRTFEEEYIKLAKEKFYTDKFFNLSSAFRHYNTNDLTEFIDGNDTKLVFETIQEIKEGKKTIHVLDSIERKIDKLISNSKELERKYIEEIIKPVFME